MKTYLFRNKEDDEVMAMCPFCNVISDNIVYEDYCTNPVFWCHESCGAEGVPDLKFDVHGYDRDLDLSSLTKLDSSDLLNLLDECKTSHESNLSDKSNLLKTQLSSKNIDLEKFDIYELHLLKIKHIVSSQLTAYVSDISRSREEIEEILYYIDTDNKNALEEMGIENLDFCHDYDPYDLRTMRSLFKLSLEVNSYDFNNPENPYPSLFDIRHDGSFIYVQLENGKYVGISGD